MNDFVITLLHDANSLIFACKTIAYILKMTDFTIEMGTIFHEIIYRFLDTYFAYKNGHFCYKSIFYLLYEIVHF